jgi:PadR family transcriptional regulator PadR
MSGDRGRETGGVRRHGDTDRAGAATGDPGGAPPAPLSAGDFHVLMVLTEGASYGYAIMKAVEQHSEGAVAPEIGSMYRILSRLMTAGWVEEVETPGDAPSSTRGRDRRYYGLTAAGRRVAHAEARRLAAVLELARSRHLLAEGGAR